MPDHVITRVMMTELEKRREQHWLRDGECAAGVPSGWENPSPLQSIILLLMRRAAVGSPELLQPLAGKPRAISRGASLTVAREPASAGGSSRNCF